MDPSASLLRTTVLSASTASPSTSFSAHPLPLPTIPAPSSSASPPPTPAKRRRTAASLADCCRTCRLRKVKCTGNPGNGPCTNCARLELACPFTDPSGPPGILGRVSRTTPSHSHTEAGTLRRRAQRACSQCHAHKTKCSGDLPVCKRCEAGGLTCEYTPAKRRFANVRFSSPATQQQERQPSAQGSVKSEDTVISPANAATAAHDNDSSHFILAIDTSSFTADEILMRKDLILRHLDAFFNYLYHTPCMGFFHPDTAYQQIQDGTFDPATAAALVSVTSFFVNPSQASREFAIKCSDEVEFYIFRNIYRFAEDTLILYALNGIFNLLNGSMSKIWQCFGIAVRLMLGHQINWDVHPQGRSFVQQECLRRIAWHFFYVDRLLAGGHEEYLSCRVENMKLPLPCNEAAFRHKEPVVAGRLQEKTLRNPATLGLHGYQIRLVDIRHRIWVLGRKLTAASMNRPLFEPSRVMAEINALQNELSRFNASLPDELKLSDQNIARYIESEKGPGYFFLHCCLGGSHVDLYSLSLPGLREQMTPEVLRTLPPEFIAKSQKQAVGHALCTARFCETIQQEVEMRPNNGRLRIAGDPSILNVTTKCLRVLLVALQHNFYKDLAGHTTAPAWRNEPADEGSIQGLINSLLRISGSWCEVIPQAQHMHESNTASVKEFNRTREFADQPSLRAGLGLRTSGTARLPGPQHILENALTGTVEEEQRSKQGEGDAADRWFRTPRPSTEPVTYPLPEGSFDVEDSVPGVPLFVAQARGAPFNTVEAVNMYDAANDLLSISNKMLPVNEYSGMIPTTSHMEMPVTSNGMPLMNLDAPTSTGMYHQNPQGPSATHFMPAQNGLYVDGYGPYSGPPASSTAYMPQNGYG